VLQERLAFCGMVHVDADVRAAALAEALWGAGRPYRVFAYVSVGTGISSTLVQLGVPFSGARGNALLLGSGSYRHVCPYCGQAFEQVLENIASGAALAQPGQTTEHLLAAADTGGAGAVQVVRAAGEALGNAVAFLVNLLDPEAVVIGGGLGLAGGLYWDSFVTAARRAIWAPATRDLPILPATLGADAGIIGAAAGLWRRPVA
jgi:glucokinase